MPGPHPGISSAAISGFSGGSYFQDVPHSSSAVAAAAAQPPGGAFPGFTANTSPQQGIASSQILSQPGPMDFRGLGMMTSSRFINSSNTNSNQTMFGPFGNAQRQQPARQGEFEIAFRKEMTTPEVTAPGTLLPDYSADPSSPLHVEPDYDTDSGIGLKEWSASMANTMSNLATTFEAQQDIIAHHHELYARKAEEARQKRNNPFGIPTSNFGFRLG